MDLLDDLKAAQRARQGPLYQWHYAYHRDGRILVADLTLTTPIGSKIEAIPKMAERHPFHRNYPGAHLTVLERHTIAKSGVGRTPD